MEGIIVYEILFEQIKTVPQEYLADIENYVGYILYRNQQPRRKRRGIKPSARISTMSAAVTVRIFS